jgi:putative membrane protein
MLRPVVRRCAIAALAVVALILGCGASDKTDVSTRAADSLLQAAATAKPAASTPIVNDSNILAVLDAASFADSAIGSIAALKGMSADVRDYGAAMMRDHHAMRIAGLELAEKLDIIPQLPPGDPSLQIAATWQDNLIVTPKSFAWDKSYIGGEVTNHEQMLGTLQTALAATQNARVRRLIIQTAARVQEQLDQAKAVQARIASM